ncbi:uncharacterized protein [Chironomus tepperi]|uniref:uncharacterized protein isoform X4 n=1 Tax=Chironomus tepperi TaxID=113505 RepID=UPI00391FC993
MNEYSIKLFLLLTVLYINNVTATTEDDFVHDGIEKSTYINCLKSEFDRHKMNEKFLKARIIHNEPQKTKLERIRDGILYNIKYKCSGAFHNGSISRFNEFVSDMGPSEAATNRLAYPKIIENLPCINQYAIDKGILSADKYNLKSTKGDCVKAVNEVMSLIRLEWDMQKASDDENTQKCLINTLKEIATEATFIKLTLLSQLNLTKEQQDAEREDFIAHTLNLREEVYNCLNKEFDEL